MTNAFAPTMEFSPRYTPAKIVTLSPIQTPYHIITAHLVYKGLLLNGIINESRSVFP